MKIMLNYAFMDILLMKDVMKEKETHLIIRIFIVVQNVGNHLFYRIMIITREKYVKTYMKKKKRVKIKLKTMN